MPSATPNLYELSVRCWHNAHKSATGVARRLAGRPGNPVKREPLSATTTATIYRCRDHEHITESTCRPITNSI